jgi:hypothetical protein
MSDDHGFEPAPRAIRAVPMPQQKSFLREMLFGTSQMLGSIIVPPGAAQPKQQPRTVTDELTDEELVMWSRVSNQLGAICEGQREPDGCRMWRSTYRAVTDEIERRRRGGDR